MNATKSRLIAFANLTVLTIVAAGLWPGVARGAVYLEPIAINGANCGGLGFIDYVTATINADLDNICSALGGSITGGRIPGHIPGLKPWEECQIDGGVWRSNRCVMPPPTCPKCAKPINGPYQMVSFGSGNTRALVFLAPGSLPISDATVPVVFGAPIAKGRSGFLVQSTFGTNGNFELVTPRSSSGIAHFWRNNDAPGLPWKAGLVFGENLGKVDSVSLIQSTFSAGGNGPGNFELMARVADRLVAFWHPDNNDVWLPEPAPQISVSGNPSLIQSRFGQIGNFELVVPRAQGGLAHFWRNNDAPGLPWNAGLVFGENLGRVDAVSLIQSTFSASGNGPGNLELVARAGDRLVAFWHPDNNDVWLPAGAPQVSVSGTPSLIQSRFGRTGNFELVVPRAQGGLAHFWRDNDAPGSLWKAGLVFGQELGRVDAVSLIESTFTASGKGPGNLEVVARIGDRLVAYWHPDNSDVWLPMPAPANPSAAASTQFVSQ